MVLPSEINHNRQVTKEPQTNFYQMIATRNANSLPLFLTFGTREKKMSVETEGPMTFVYDELTQMTYYMGGSGTTMSKRSVKKKALFGHYDSNEQCKDDEC